MKIIELDRNYCREHYNGNYSKMIENEDGVIFDDNTIKLAFNFHNGTNEHLKCHIENNRQYCRYYDLENNKYV